MSLLQAASLPHPLFAVSRVVEGVAHLALVAGGPPLMAAAASDRARPLVMGLWAVFFGASLAISTQIFPPLLRLGGWRWIFASHGALLLALAAVLWRRVPRLPRARTTLDPVAIHRAIYGDFRYMAPGLGFACYTFLFVAAISTLPGALGRPALATILPLVTLAATLAGDALLPPVRAAPRHRGGLCRHGRGARCAGLSVPFAAEAAFACVGLVPGACFAAIPAWNAAPAERARAAGAIAQLGNVGTVNGTPVFVLVAVKAGLPGLIWLMGIVAVAGPALALSAGLRAMIAAQPPEHREK